jgi:hypothetical protein
MSGSTTSLVLAALIAVTGCSRAQPRPTATTQPVNSAQALVLAQRVAQVDTEAAEPMIVEHPSGMLFVAGIGGPWTSNSQYYANRRYWDALSHDRLWKSGDRGATWTSVDLSAGTAGALGQSDVDIAVGPDGTLYVVSMTFDVRLGEGREIAVGVSHDVGDTWTWAVLSTDRFDDRPWVVVAPDSTAHVIWNDGKGVQHVSSHDAGRSWSAPARVHDSGGSSHLAVGPRGELAVRLIPWSASHNFLDPGVDLIAVSSDGGTSWTRWPAPGQRDWRTLKADTASLGYSGPNDTLRVEGKPRPRHSCCSETTIPHWIEPLAWDGEGRLYSLWTDTTGVWLARSADRGATWDTWHIVESHARILSGHSPVFADWGAVTSRLHHGVYFPYLVARGDGELAATWHVSDGDSLHWQVARIDVGHRAPVPRVAVSPLLDLDTYDWGDSTHAAGLLHVTAGEYLGMTFLRDGGIGVITPLQITRTGPVGFTYWRFGPR